MGSIQRGAIVSRNDNGTLERIDGKSAYVGTATLASGKVLKKTFRSAARDDDEVTARWLKWQGRQEECEQEDDCMAEIERTGSECPMTGFECKHQCPLFSVPNGECSIKLGCVALYNIGSNLMKLDNSESIELLAMAVSEVGKGMASTSPLTEVAAKETTPSNGVSEFMDGKNFLAFVNLHSKTVYSAYRKLCTERGFAPVKEKALVEEIEKRCPELKGKGVSGGTVFQAA